ncbi:hypothetical protein [Actinomadura madurae]|uniref:hypothetical protein n=1 Tax=Actinomadura madurae TaxID=1993 RepID=UPI0020D25E4D|nr:hypothetical protein [Actinomadura madurae]MCP9964062.1 hypothetical protein [Actinomadura madurae]MCP9976537.1 hypothetical protein [Actinomadura madurae]MCQ0011965.1 hypothetical protein [Actinomadura madurae]MCQ0012733.1 hypothetical protein [Actinomadura madurae]
MRDGLVHTLSAENEARLHILISAQKPKLSNAVRQTLQELTTEHADDWRFEYVAGDPNPWRAVRDKGAHAEVRARAPEVLRDRIRVVEWADGSDDQAAGQ